MKVINSTTYHLDYINMCMAYLKHVGQFKAAVSVEFTAHIIFIQGTNLVTLSYVEIDNFYELNQVC